MSNEKKQLPEVPVTKFEQKAPELTPLEQAIKAVANEMIPAAIAAAIHSVNAGQPRAAAPPPARQVRQVCSDCKQDKITGCGGKHAYIVVYPTRYEEAQEFFPGVFLNGVKYLSNNMEHEVCVPESAAGDILNTVQRFEQNEHEQRVGRSKKHHSGAIGPGGNAINPAHAAWR